MKRRVDVLILVAASLAAPACGAGEREDAAATFARFAEAAAAGDTDGMWEFLSARTKARIMQSEFARHASLLREREGAVAGGRVILNAQIEDDLAVAALAGGDVGPGARAAVLRLEDGIWRVQLSELDLIYGGSFLEFGVNTGGRSVLVETRAWVDGEEGRVRCMRKRASLIRWFEVIPRGPLLEAGEHSVVIFARSSDRSGAIASMSDGAR